MRVAYYIDDYPGCNLTDLDSLLKCLPNGSGIEMIFTHFCQIMSEPIELIGFPRERVGWNNSGGSVLKATIKAVADGIADTTLSRQSINEDRLSFVSFAMPLYETHFAIAVNRELSQLKNSYNSNYFTVSFSPILWALFLILSFVCIFLEAKYYRSGGFKYHLVASAAGLHAFLVVTYNAALQADFVRSVVPHIPYESLDDVAKGILKNDIQLLTGNTFNVIAKHLKTSPKENWKRLNEALHIRPIVNFGNTTANNCKEVARNHSFVMLDIDYEFQAKCVSELQNLQLVLLEHEPETTTAYVFSKNSKYLEKAVRNTEFLVAEYYKYQRRLLKSHQMMPTPMHSYSMIILLADIQKLFVFYAMSLVVMTAVCAIEILVAKLKSR